MNKFYKVPCKAYPHKLLDISKGVVRSQELLCSIRKKKNFKIKGDRTKNSFDKTIKADMYYITFKTQKIPERIKVGYTMKRVEQYIPNSLSWYKC